MTQPPRLDPYESTADEVLEQYELTPKQIATVKARVAATGCPWFSKHVYARTHHAASQYTRELVG